jgi:hypothetical protein
MLEAAASGTLFPCRIESDFECNTPSKSYFSRGRKDLFVTIRPIKLKRRNTFICQKKNIPIRSRGINTLFPSET